jgi:hypothetical protein
MAYVLARVLAKRLNFSGDPHLVDRYPMAFLARVFATFHQVHEEEDEDGGESVPIEPRRARQELAGVLR